MGVELIKDQKGKSHMVFSKDVAKDDLLMGENIDDYEILQVLGEGSFGYVAKVKSRINHKIYAIKKLNFSQAKNKKEMELAENEVSILKNLNHPLITKYYKSFKEGENLFIVMEFMDNGDLGKLIKGHKTLNKPMEEERLWNIFIQALKSLEFVHSKGIIHRDIKPENLFIGLDGTIKLGDFGVSANYKNKNSKKGQNNPQNNMNPNMQQNMQANLGKIDCKGTVVGTVPFMSPEMIENTEYDLTTDVYSMGCAFFESMYWAYPRNPAMDLGGLIEGKNFFKLVEAKIKFNKDVYSKELHSLIQKMIEFKKELRPDSTTILNLFIEEYNKKYCKSSNIGSVLSCLYSYTELIQYFKTPNNEQNISNKRNSISYAFLYGLNSFLNNNLNLSNKEDWRSTLFKIRTLLSHHNFMYHANNEINPRYFLYLLLGRMHKELNQKRGSYQNPFNSLFSGELNQQQQNLMNSINYSNKEESFKYFINNFNENNNSIISNYFYGNMKTKTVCGRCQLTTYSFTSFDFITFNIDLVQKFLMKNNFQNLMNKIDLNLCFSCQNNTLIQSMSFLKYCRQCLQNQIHSERKQFYTFPRYLIICLDRGADCENKTKIFYNTMLNLTSNYDNPNSFSFFMLKGIVKRFDVNNKEHYISIYYDFNQKSWIVRDDSKTQKINSPLEHNQGIEVILFFEAIINNNMNNNNMMMNSNMSVSNNNMQNMVNNNMNGTNMSNINMNNMNMGNMNGTNMNMIGMGNNNMNMNNFNNMGKFS